MTTPRWFTRLLSEDEARLVVRVIIWAVIVVMVWPLVNQVSGLLTIFAADLTDPLSGVR